jgi:multisubunit Na+/H+ antiporter MnhB subunit
MLKKRKEPFLVHDIIISLIIVLLFIESSSIVMWTLNSFDYQEPFESEAWLNSAAELSIFSVDYRITAFLVTLFLWFWIIPVLRYFRLFQYQTAHSVKTAVSYVLLKTKKRFSYLFSSANNNYTTASKYSRIILVLSIVLSSYVSLYAYSIHEEGLKAIIGVDTPFYVRWMQSLKDDDPSAVIYKAFVARGWDQFADQLAQRPLALLIIYIFYNTFNLQNLAFPILTASLSASTCLVFYLLTKEITNNQQTAYVAALFSAVSSIVIVSVFAGSFANWMGLLLFLVIMLQIIRIWYSPKLIHLAISIFAVVGLLLIHPWTWYVALTIIVTLIAYRLLSRKSDVRSKETISLTIVLAVGIIMDFINSNYYSGLTAGSRIVTEYMDLSNYFDYWRNILVTLRLFALAGFSNPVLYVLSIIALLSLYKNRTHGLIVILVWIGILGAGVRFIENTHDVVSQYRVLYLAPFPILCAIGANMIAVYLRGIARFDGMLVYGLVIALFVGIFLNFALRSIAGLPING